MKMPCSTGRLSIVSEECPKEGTPLQSSPILMSTVAYQSRYAFIHLQTGA